MAYRGRRHKIVKRLRLQQNEEDRDIALQNLKTIELRKQNSQFPPKKTWLIEGSDYYHKLWASHLATGRLHDRRTTRKTVQHNTDSINGVISFRCHGPGRHHLLLGRAPGRG